MPIPEESKSGNFSAVFCGKKVPLSVKEGNTLHNIITRVFYNESVKTSLNSFNDFVRLLEESMNIGKVKDLSTNQALVIRL